VIEDFAGRSGLPAPSSRPRTAGGRRPREPRVLVVDDDRETLDVLTDYLEGEGCAVGTVATSRAALESVHREPPDLVLLGSTLSEANGFEVLSRLGRSHPEVPVLVLAGPDDEALARSTFRLGAVGCVRKPVSLEGLRQAVAAATAKTVTPRR
jgi:CheY-like chemotaxis protein